VVGVCKQTIAELARDYGITIKRNGRGKYAVDPEWLLDQHVNKGRRAPALLISTRVTRRFDGR
jgi:hypothetical protein